MLSKISIPEARGVAGFEPFGGHPIERLAFFLDIDGTLISFAETPNAVTVDGALRSLLERLAQALGGGVALVTGRALADVERLFPGLALPVAGQHGAEFRGLSAALPEVLSGDVLHQLRSGAEAARRAHPRLLFEDKGRSVAIHYRRAPALAPIARWLALRLAGAGRGQLVVQRGHYVEEVKSSSANKGDAIRRLLEEPAFRGRMPVFIGDDVTDEDGFRVVNETGGVSIKVGSGPTVAHWRLRSPAAVLDWLSQVADALEQHGRDDKERA